VKATKFTCGDQPHHQRHEAELKRDRQPRAQQLPHRGVLPKRAAEIGVQENAADPVKILLPHRAIETERTDELVTR